MYFQSCHIIFFSFVPVILNFVFLATDSLSVTKKKRPVVCFKPTQFICTFSVRKGKCMHARVNELLISEECSECRQELQYKASFMCCLAVAVALNLSLNEWCGMSTHCWHCLWAENILTAFKKKNLKMIYFHFV